MDTLTQIHIGCAREVLTVMSFSSHRDALYLYKRCINIYI